MASVRQGISTDYSKERFDVGLGEEDLPRLMREYDVELDTKYLSTSQAVHLLALECERFVLIQSPKYGSPVAQVIAQLQANREEFAGALAEVANISVAEARKRLKLPDA